MMGLSVYSSQLRFIVAAMTAVLILLCGGWGSLHLLNTPGTLTHIHVYGSIYARQSISGLAVQFSDVQAVSGGTASLPWNESDATTNPVSTLAQQQTAVPFTTWQEKAKYQQNQVEKFCQYYGLGSQKYQMPPGDNRLYRYLLTNNDHKTVFCFVPKAGCTTLKMLFFVTQGLIPTSELSKSRDSVDQNKLRAAINKTSFRYLSSDRRMYNLKNFFKFTMYRNPLERLVSAYRSKVQRFHLSGLKDEQPPFNWVRKVIYHYKHPTEYEVWKKTGGQPPLNVSFTDFIDCWLSGITIMRGDVHFLTTTEICHPCRVRFDFYGNFKNFDEDSKVLMDHIHAKPELLRPGYYSEDNKTDHIISDYFGALSYSQKKAVLATLAQDLDFYYHLFPEETDIHKTILDISDGIPQWWDPGVMTYPSQSQPTEP